MFDTTHKNMLKVKKKIISHNVCKNVKLVKHHKFNKVQRKRNMFHPFQHSYLTTRTLGRMKILYQEIAGVGGSY